MAENTQTKVLVMTFKLFLDGELKKKKSIRVANPVDNLEGKSVHKFMKIIGDNRLFWCDGYYGDIVLKPFNAKVVTTNTKDVELVSVDE